MSQLYVFCDRCNFSTPYSASMCTTCGASLSWKTIISTEQNPAGGWHRVRRKSMTMARNALTRGLQELSELGQKTGRALGKVKDMCLLKAHELEDDILIKRELG